MPEFVHLHNHTHYSLLDAACTPDQLIAAAVSDGQRSLALTDHGVMFGALEFYNKSREAGIKPILGFAAYIANGSRFDKSSGKTTTKKKNYFHLVLLAKNKIGYHNLLKLTTLGHSEGFYYKPRIDRELLLRYNEGIIACSACIAGVVSSPLIAGDYESARENAIFYRDLFGPDFYLELQDHDLPEDKIIMREVPKLAAELGIPLVATNDVHYTKAEHAIAHNVLLYIKDVTKLDADKIDIYKLRYRSPELYFKTTEQMCNLFADYPDAIENTVKIAEQCELSFEKHFFMPGFPIPEGSKANTLEEFLDEQTEKGLRERFPEITEEIRARIDYELDVIKKMGFAGYFLIVQDFIVAARSLGVSVGPGRGSAAGSLVAYCLGITNVNPLPYDLLFERFLNPERVSMPDIDIDFSDTTRERVIEYVKQKYGENSVAQIITFGKLSSRAVLKDVGRVLNIPHTQINTITSKIPVEQGKVKPLSEALELAELKWVMEGADEKMKQLIEYSLLLEGLYRNSSIHAAGVVIAPGDVSNYVPLYMSPNSKGVTADFATQYSMNDLEQAGLLKMDFLGLRTLSIIEDTLDMIEQNHGIRIDLDAIDFSDEKTFELLSAGSTLAVFQFESNGMQEYLRQLKPHSLEELTAMNALYRPGPMDNIPDFIDRKHGKKPIEYLHPIMEKSLKNTYGIIVYQEQVMQLARDISGFSLAQADNLRRAMGKKKQSEMDKMMPLFLEGARKNGIDEQMAMEIFELIQKFAKYGFNKSHSLAYSYLAFQTAYLKAHYPAEFLAANMSAELNDQKQIVSLIEEAKKFGIDTLPPDVNRSLAKFSAQGNKIIFGLAGIKNVGMSAVENIIKARSERPFKSFFDFAARTDSKSVNKRAIESLVCAGAFDSFEKGTRAEYFASIELAIEYSKKTSENERMGADSLFGGSSEALPVEPQLIGARQWTEKERLEKEKDVLNFYMSGNPLSRYQLILESLPVTSLDDIEKFSSSEQVRICGLVTDIRTRLDKKDNTIAFVTVEDLNGRAECIFWSKTYTNFKNALQPDKVILIIGKPEVEGDNLKVVAEQVLTIDNAMEKFINGFRIWIDLDKTDTSVIEKFSSLCCEPGASSSIVFNVSSANDNIRTRYLAYGVNISPKEQNIIKICEIFGTKNVKLLPK